MLQFEHLCNLSVDVGEIVSMGPGPLGERREAVDLVKCFFRSILRFETEATEPSWLNKTITVATAEHRARQILLTAYRLP